MPNVGAKSGKAQHHGAYSEIQGVDLVRHRHPGRKSQGHPVLAALFSRNAEAPAAGEPIDSAPAQSMIPEKIREDELSH